MNEGVAYIISDILADNFARQMAFGPHSALEIPGYKVAVKTGTTNDKKDNWTVGYNPDFLVLVWVGNNDNSPMHPYLTSGITGAAPIWNRVMTELLKNYNQQRKWFNKPTEITERICYFGKVEYFVKGTENKVSCREGLFTPSPTISR
jgi:membrane peptidoglycan carboxypeptidase